VSFKKERKIRIFSNNRYISINYEKKSIQVYTLNKGDRKVIKAKDFLTCFKMKKLKFSSNIDQLQLEIESFVNCIKSRITPEVSGVEGRNALETALKILSNAEVNLNDTVC
jgi:predicted dehydrogenase